MGVCIVVLAAGRGERYRASAGQDVDKLLQPFTGVDGAVRPLLEHVLLSAQGITAQRLLVTRPGKPAVNALARRYGFAVYALESPGLGCSLAAAIAQCPDATGWLVLLGDMPGLRASTLQAVAAAMAPGRIAVACGAEGYGHPVGFDQAFAVPLSQLQGDRGARCLLVPPAVLEVPVDDPGIYFDVDVPG